MTFELLPGINGAGHFVEQFVGGLDLANDLIDPWLWNVTVRTRRPNARPVLEVDRLLVFLVDVVPHFVTRDAECLRVSRLQNRVEPAPKNNAGYEHQYAAQWNPQQIPPMLLAPYPRPTSFGLFAFRLVYHADIPLGSFSMQIGDSHEQDLLHGLFKATVVIDQRVDIRRLELFDLWLHLFGHWTVAGTELFELFLEVRHPLAG